MDEKNLKDILSAEVCGVTVSLCIFFFIIIIIIIIFYLFFFFLGGGAKGCQTFVGVGALQLFLFPHHIYCAQLQVERDVAQSIACPHLKRSVVGSILLSGPSCSLGYFPFQPVVHNWFIKGRGMYCSVYGKVHIKDPLLLIEKSSLCGGSGFPSKKCVNVTI